MKTMRLRRRLMEIIMFVSLITMILRRRLMEIIMFVSLICWGVLIYLDSWSMVSTWYIILSSFFEVIFVHLIL